MKSLAVGAGLPVQLSASSTSWGVSANSAGGSDSLSV